MTEADVLPLVARVEAAWNARDVDQLAAYFAEDADFVTPLSHWVRGRNEIRRIHASGLATLFRNNVVRYELAAFREIAPGVAVVQVRWQSDGHLASGPRKTTETRRGIATWTVRGRGREVEIAAAHGTEMPAAPSA